jgi:hypothetical protein
VTGFYLYERLALCGTGKALAYATWAADLFLLSQRQRYIMTRPNEHKTGCFQIELEADRFVYRFRDEGSLVPGENQWCGFRRDRFGMPGHHGFGGGNVEQGLLNRHLRLDRLTSHIQCGFRRLLRCSLRR